MTLPRVTFDCEVLTPLFLAGADPNGSPEVRAPSIRGVMRWWYRALLGGRGITDLATLHKKEEAVFGSTERASPVRLRVLPYEVEGHERSNKSIDNLENQNTGTGYLWYFVQAGDNDRCYIAPGARFEVQLLAKPGNQETLEEAAKAFWLLVHLGGLGTRSRRMAGAVAADCVDAPDGLPSFAPDEDYDAWFTRQLERIGVGGVPQPDMPAFSVLHPDWAHVSRLRGVEEEEWTDLVEAVGTKFEEHRGDLDIPAKVGLGLPMVTPPGTDDINVTQSGKDIDRRASPLWLQVVRLKDGTLSVVATLMWAQFAAGETQVTVRWEGKREIVDDPYQRLGTFVRDHDFNAFSLLSSQQ